MRSLDLLRTRIDLDRSDLDAGGTILPGRPCWPRFFPGGRSGTNCRPRRDALPEMLLQEVCGAVEGVVMPNNAFERAVRDSGPRLAAAEPSWPAAQLGR